MEKSAVFAHCKLYNNMSELMTLGDLAEGKCASDFTGAKATGEGYVGINEYIKEAELHGSHVYWHGSQNTTGSKIPPKIETEKAQELGGYPCFFFTTHFGYALSYVYNDKSDLGVDDGKKKAEIYKPYGKFIDKIPMSEELIAGTNEWAGWIYPIKLPHGINIFLAGSLNDERKLYEIIMKSEYKKFYPDYDSIRKLCLRLSKNDWFFLDNETSKYGFTREELLLLMEKYSSYKGVDGENHGGYAGFYGFHNFETSSQLSSIGMFKTKMGVLQVDSPFKVEYKDGHILIL
jgi:hypothetical protein